MKTYNEQELAVIKAALEEDYLLFVRFFSKIRWGVKFIVNWHHEEVVGALMRVVRGETNRLIINIPPGGSKTELVVINFMTWCLANNPYCKFLHLSYADSLAELNSSTAKEIIELDEYQSMWSIPVAGDSSAKKRWNIEIDGKKAGGCYATSVGGQVTGFRAGRMAEGFNGCILLDDPLKPDDAWSKVKRDRANRFLTNTIKSRLATAHVPIIIIMQRVHEADPTGFLVNGPSGGDWEVLSIPAINEHGESYWPYKEPVEELLKLRDEDSYTFNSQYMQKPTPEGGGMFKHDWFDERYTAEDLKEIKQIELFADTAMKKGQHNDFSVIQAWGTDHKRVFLLDQIRGKWEAPELLAKSKEFWKKWTNGVHTPVKATAFNIEDKASGTGLIQTFKTETTIPAIAIQRDTDKVSRGAACAPYCESRKVLLPEDAKWVNMFLGEITSFTANMTHDHDDQVDPMLDAINKFIKKPRRRAFGPSNI